jgi:hypothetical protein
MVHGKFARDNLFEVVFDFLKTFVEALEGFQLVGDLVGEGADGVIFDITKKVLDTDFFGFFGFDGGGEVVEGAGCGSSVLLNINKREIGVICFSCQ